ncbi:MAG: ABC transporter substrate-binding protein [Deltaproteobacteria bacterium]|nr:ABC transporter substrate-binding protein [Deltaproteobacteria bacterium]
MRFKAVTLLFLIILSGYALAAGAAQPSVYCLGLAVPEGLKESEPVIRGLELYLEVYQSTLKQQLSREFGIAPPDLEVCPPGQSVATPGPGATSLPYDQAVKEVSSTLVKLDNSIAMIGNPAQEYDYIDYEFHNREKIPLISLAATEGYGIRQSNYIFSMVYDDTWQGMIMATYVKEILEAKSVLILFSADNKTLSDSFSRQSAINGLKIAGSFQLSQKDLMENNLTPRLGRIKDHYDQIILLLQSEIAVEAVRQLSLAGIKTPLVGPDDLSSPKFISGLKSLPRHLQPKKILVANPFFFELTTVKARDLIELYREKYHRQEPSQFTVYAFDAAYLITRGLMHGLKQGKTSLPELRRAVKEYLESINSPDQAVEGMSGRLYFDRDGVMRRPVIFSWLRNGEFYPAYTQLLGAQPYDPTLMTRSGVASPSGEVLLPSWSMA